MARDLTAAALTAVESNSATIALFAFLDFPDAEARVTTLPVGMDVEWDGFTWRGLNEFGSISAAKETSDLSDSDITLTLNGVIPSTVSIALNLNYQGREFTVYQAYFDDNMQLISDPFIISKGLINNMIIKLGKEGTIQLSGTSRAKDLSRPREKRRNNETHQRKYPGDTFYNKVEDTARAELRWGSGLLKNGQAAIVN